MTTYRVTTQAELDAALVKADEFDEIVIVSESGVWLEVGGFARASGSATVSASGSATVHAGSHTAVHLRSARATIDGGVLIDHTTLNLTAPADWCDYHGVQVTDGNALLYKAVNANLTSDHGTTYPLGETVTAPDWRDTYECGNGLHFGPTPHHADAYHSGHDGTRYLAVHVPLQVLRPITDGGTAKCKAQSCTVLHEVDVAGRPVEQQPAVA
ncbi:MAG: DUF7666 domain-containing protein [Motilibacteraceae bacterium]